ncbi:SDH family Clp fold serine proteinase [Sphingopyxis sp. GC21]|uniref:SDH family Clp fold serine proteinase n=1 Tax=Sphingopyxis sp. GC21 TaxID=2933562 RepID=UPI0021E3C6CE|nr:hypothetical protein [Sphingopyxis sp. GC21]
MSDYSVRKSLLEQIEQERSSRALLYVTGDRPGMETQISDVIDMVVDHLDTMWPANRISLILHTKGGNTAIAWQLVNLLRTFCDELEVVVPSRALSAGTLISLGANRIVMTKQAVLGPIDPSLNSPLGPQIPGSPHRAAVSVEAIQGYLNVAQSELGITDANALASIWNNLSAQIHPLVLGQIYRTRQQIRDLAKRLLEHQKVELQQAEKIVSFLCSESGSHDHAINRREASELGLAVEKPSADFYEMLRKIEASYVEELMIRVPWNPDTQLAGNPSIDYDVPRALIESTTHGSHQFASKGTLTQLSIPNPNGPPQIGLKDERKFEAWQKVA